MSECKKCGKKFHACFSCGLIGREWDYCSDSCWNSSDEKEKMIELFDSLTERQVELISELVDCSDYDTEFERWVFFKFSGWDYKNIKAI